MNDITLPQFECIVDRRWISADEQQEQFEAIYKWNDAYKKANKIAPSLREMASSWGCSPQAASNALSKLEEMGWIELAHRDERRIQRYIELRRENGVD